MNSIAQISENEQREIKGTLKKFFTEYHLSGLLKMYRAEKQKGHPPFSSSKPFLERITLIGDGTLLYILFL